MGSRLKEEERNERTIRGLLKLSENRRCINCGSMGPQYVCTNFSIFVCTSCSGVHREFTHRIKSISMAKFTAAEVDSLKNGGNDRAREIFLKEWDSQRNTLPDSSNPDKLREFIKTVYVDRRYTGDRLPPKPRAGDRDDSYETRRPEYRTGSRSPPYDDRRGNDRRRSDVDRGRPPLEDRRYDDRNDDRKGVRFDEKRSPGRFESDRGRYEDRDRRYEDRDRRYEDRRYDEPRYEERPRYEDRDRRPDEVRDRRRPDDRNAGQYRDYDGGNSPQAEPRKDLRIPKLSPSGSFGNGGSSNSSSISLQRAPSDSLIDFSVETPTAAPTATATANVLGVRPLVQPPPPASNDTGWATFDTAFGQPTHAAPEAPAPTTSTAAALSGLFSGGGNSGTWNGGWGQPVVNPTNVPDNSWSAFPAQIPQASAAQSWNSFPVAKGGNSSFSNLEQPNSASQLGERPRRELPQDIFAASFQSPFQPTIMQNPGVQAQNPAFLTGGAQFHTMGPPIPGQVPVYAQPPRSRNPFDLPGDPQPAMPVAFPSMAPLQAALPSFPSGPQSVPGLGPGASGAGNFQNPWGAHQSFGQPQHSSYPPGTSLGGSGFPVLPPQSIPGDRNQAAPFGQDTSFFNHRPQLHSQNSMPALGFPNSFPGLTSQHSLPPMVSQGSVSSIAGNPFG
eukprot:TRINITY_DN88_c0_g1_i3.p1 TRINITY_DN88_c0_g1~~TRINITY_DN88_c0_g1_i3.p1  ORF type:complete len:671 (-),score=107.98 TRINITY_DN88_c0_g1_i3:809-2821(-)